jgi:hypothetical protein
VLEVSSFKQWIFVSPVRKKPFKLRWLWTNALAVVDWEKIAPYKLAKSRALEVNNWF